MNTTTAPSTQLNRAYVESKVIEANLEHLRVVLLDADADLRDGLRPITEGFGRYVRSIGEASTLADAVERVADGGPVTPAPVRGLK
jgi:hypothetical protein